MNQKEEKNSFLKCVSKIADVLLDIVYPKKCICCNCLSPIGRRSALCDDCRNIVGKMSKVVVEPDSHFEEVICALPYEGNVRDSMLRYKFHSKRYLSAAFGEALRILVGDRDFVKDYDIICAVPIHPMRDREYNQALLIAKEFATECGAVVADDMLIKLKDIKPLSTMGYLMRRTSIKGSIEFNLKYDIFSKNILLIDDIFTTGSTANECSGVLKMHGAQKVTVLAACYRKGDDDNFYADNLRN